MRFKPVVAVTIGDPVGIGPEIVVKALSRRNIYRQCHPLAVGDLAPLEKAIALVGLDLKLRACPSVKNFRSHYGIIDVVIVHPRGPGKLPMSQVSAAAGQVSLDYLGKAVELAEAGLVHGIAAAPQNKQAMMLAPGYTTVNPFVLDIMAMSEQRKRMVQLGNLRIIGVTGHVPLRQVPDMITKASVLETIELAHEALREMGIAAPRIGVSALNPHAGEGGLVGREDVDEIAPAVESARQKGIDVQGPIPGDTIFPRAKAGEFDVAVAMYHDLTTGPPKLLRFGQGVTMSLGLPFPAAITLHGTAFDIAWQGGRANPQSMVDVIEVVAHMASVKQTCLAAG